MRQKELRLALVCYGGISLAVYMYGVTREIQKLVRASKLYFSRADPKDRQTGDYDALNQDLDRETDSERGYFELLKALGRSMELKVFVDIVSGASAGGINGIFLARAIAHDLPLDPLRVLWLDQADVEQLIDPDNRQNRLIKTVKRPAIWLIRRRNYADIETLQARIDDPEVGQKLALFVGSRWFRPPFSGRWLTNMLLTGAEAMGSSETSQETCIPGSRPLDLFVTVTDFLGHRQYLALHDPPMIEEVEHRLILSFQHRLSPLYSRRDFADDNLPAIAFAARATSSFPGAFPPARLVELDRILEQRGVAWPKREEFIHRCFEPHIRSGLDPGLISLVDGSVLNNKPFGPAIEVLRSRVAHRQVDRRIVYIDPNPPTPRDTRSTTLPGFFRTLAGAVSEIPRNQPIRDDLEALTNLSRETAHIRGVIDHARPGINQTIERLLGPALRKSALTPKAIAHWRTRASALAEKNAGYAFEGYLSMRLLMLVEELVRAVARFSRQDLSEVDADVRAWAETGKMFPFDIADKARPWTRALDCFDMDFRIRRIRFVIRRINDLYYRTGANSDALDSLKGVLYNQHSTLRGIMNGPLLFSLRREVPVPERLEQLAQTYALAEVDAEIDQAVAGHLDWLDQKEMGREILMAYLGFDFYDALVYPISRRPDLDELDEVCVDRISPEDARSLSEEGKSVLRGLEFGRFGAFFSSSFRENDYLWGRLHGAERLIDIVASSAAASGVEINRRMFKQIVFLQILEREAPRLLKISDLTKDLRRRVDGIAPPPDPEPPRLTVETETLPAEDDAELTPQSSA